MCKHVTQCNARFNATLVKNKKRLREIYFIFGKIPTLISSASEMGLCYNIYILLFQAPTSATLRVAFARINVHSATAVTPSGECVTLWMSPCCGLCPKFKCLARQVRTKTSSGSQLKLMQAATLDQV